MHVYIYSSNMYILNTEFMPAIVLLSAKDTLVSKTGIFLDFITLYTALGKGGNELVI